MTPFEMASHLIVLETFAMTALALVSSNAIDGPGYQRANMLLDHLKESAQGLAADQNSEVQEAALQYSQYSSAIVRKNLENIQPGGTRVQ